MLLHPEFTPCEVGDNWPMVRTCRYVEALRELRRLAGMESRSQFIDQDRCGNGQAFGHCGEFFQGALALNGWWGEQDREFRRWLPATSRYLDEAIDPLPPPSMTVQCLVDVPCSVWTSKAQVLIRRSRQATIEGAAPQLSKSRRALALLLDLCDVRNVAAYVAIESTIPPGKGCGSSSADVMSTLRAGCEALGLVMPDRMMGILACMSERASNPVHLSRPVLFAQRRGRVLRELGPVWPGFHALGFDPGGVVDTDQLKPVRHTGADLQRCLLAVDTLQEAMRSGDAAALAQISSSVAPVDERLAHDHDQIRRWVRDYGALGYAVSHSGVVGTLLWPKTGAGMVRRDVAASALRSYVHGVWTWSI